MVTQITAGTAFDRRGQPFRRRNPRPALYALAVLAVATGVVWAVALTRPSEVHQATACNTPPASTEADQPKLGERAAPSAMMQVVPAKLIDTNIRVLNASGQNGQAEQVAGELHDLGFAAPTYANDPIYAHTRMDCQGQIRFGDAGQAGAAAVWLVAPCTELFHDDRTDNSVDLVLGADFTGLTQSDDISTVLASLRPDAVEASDLALLSKIHTGTC